MGSILCMFLVHFSLPLSTFAFQEQRMRQGNKKIFHLEAWVIKVMSIYKASQDFNAISSRMFDKDFDRALFSGSKWMISSFLYARVQAICIYTTLTYIIPFISHFSRGSSGFGIDCPQKIEHLRTP